MPPHSFLPEANWGANAGLAVARDLLEPVKQKFPWISYRWVGCHIQLAAVQHGRAAGPGMGADVCLASGNHHHHQISHLLSPLSLRLQRPVDACRSYCD